MARAEDTELIDVFEEFYRSYYRNEIGDLAQKYPTERKSLYVDWGDLYRFDPALADDFRNKPEQLREYAEEALRLYDLPVDVSLGQAHVRVRGLPEATDIRDIRADNRGQLIAVQGIVRKATEVRPKVTNAAFECQRCGTLTRIPQSDGDFQEPHECQGCERQGPFRVNFDQSEFVDAQKLRVQESPEGLRGGETPQAIDVNIEDDITGEVTAGDHVTVTGILKLDQRGNDREKSPMFDTYMTGLSVEIEDEQFEDMDITDEDKTEIVELSNDPDIYDKMVGAIAPSIYGYENEKLAMILQLFSGVTKHLPDDTRLRGDLHMLLIGDPGTGKSMLLQYIRQIAPRSVYTSGKGSSAAGLCVTGDTMVHTSDGFVPIRDLATTHHPEPVAEETAADAAHEVYTFDRGDGTIGRTTSSHVWRMPEKPCRRVETAHGKQLEASRDTPLLVCDESGLEWREISAVEPGDRVAVPSYDDIERSSPAVREFFEFTREKLKPTDASVEFLRRRLREEFGTLREAAAALDLPEDFVYDSLSNRHLSLDRLGRVLDAVDATLDDLDIERAMLRHGDGVMVPDAFDEDLLYLVGLVFGDGDVMVSQRGENRGRVRISNSNEAVLRDAAEIIERTFGKRVHIERQEDRVPCIRLHSATVARFFSNLGAESPKDDIALAPELTTAAHADAFLRGLFDADGSVSVRDNGGSSIQFSTTCDRFARQVQLMLESYGIRARRRERDRRGTYEMTDGRQIESTSVQTHLAIYGRNIDTFADEIGFSSARKSERLAEIVEDVPRRGERLPIGEALTRTDGAGGAYYRNLTHGTDPSRERANGLLEDRDLGDVADAVGEVVNADLVWDEVTAATDTGHKEVFDLTVPGTHNFVGNGIITHNTAAAVRDDFGDGQQWTLEAGALVLADQGIAAVDELDKMRCVTGDTLVQLGDGRISRIRDLAREAERSGDIEELPNGKTIRGVDVEAWTMTDGGELVRRPVTAIHEYEAPEALTRVELRTGERVTATDDHPFLIFTDGQRERKAASDLDEGDWVYVPRGLPTAAADGGVASAAPTDGERAAEENLSPAFAAVLGYLSGDGNVYYDDSEGVYGIRFTNAEERLLADFEWACADAFDATPVRPPSEQREDGMETVRLPGKAYAEAVLDAGMNLETYDGKRLPEGVSEAGRAAKAAFLRALADSEGSVGARSVRLFSSSYELLMGSKQLLLEFGVSSQIQTRDRDDGRDVYVLAITDADSLAAFDEFVGFTLDRKQRALDDAVGAVSGDRTILDVIPEVGDLLHDTRESLRLHQSECGLNDATYCEFENERANVSIRAARDVLDAFRERKRRAKADQDRPVDADWPELKRLKRRYHVSQAELAEGTAYSQQQISRWWGEDERLRQCVRERLAGTIDAVAGTDLAALESLVYSDLKWRQVESVETTTPDEDAADDRIRLLRRELSELLDCESACAERRARELLATEPTPEDWETLRSELERHGVPLQDLAGDLGVAESTVSRWSNGIVETDRFEEVRAAALDRIDAVRADVAELLDEIDARGGTKVYDLTVSGTHNFLANGMIVHNSEDRSAMHEALEQQSISVSKAGINATLKSRCSLLGAANPKYGRFDQYEPIGEQIDLEPALISRFDLIFTVTDEPDEERDAELAEHILQTNYAGELNTHRAETSASNYTEEEVATVTDEVAPTIEPDLLRKYIAYAKRNCFPTMTEEAKAEIQQFYVDLRARGTGEDAPVPVTARKLEALVRLAEASARVRLSDTVDREDAERATDIVRSCLEDIGMDPETGEFDADVVETGTSKSQRDRIKGIKNLIAEIESEYDEGAPVDVVIERAEEEGMDASKAEHEIEKLKQKGEVYTPSTDHLRTT